METTQDKINSIKAVQYATEEAMQGVITYLQSTARPTSEEAHQVIDSILNEHSCESPEGHIVAAGIQSSEPHEIGKGEIARSVPIVIDIYPRSKENGYYADMSRTVCLGTPSKELQKMYDCVLAAQELAISLLKPGVACATIQESVDNFFTTNGYVTSGKGKEFKFKEGFVHSVGHGVSKKLHDTPRIGRGSTDIFKEGDVVTIEPGLYYENVGGVRIEDLLVITPEGAKNLTNFSKTFCL